MDTNEIMDQIFTMGTGPWLVRELIFNNPDWQTYEFEYDNYAIDIDVVGYELPRRLIITEYIKIDGEWIIAIDPNDFGLFVSILGCDDRNEI